MMPTSSARGAGAGATPPRATSLRLVGPAAEHARGSVIAPFGAKFQDDARAYAVALGPPDAVDVTTVARALPEPDDLPAGTLLVVLPQVVDRPSLGRRLLAVLGRGRTVSRALRSTALVARGYVRVGAGVDSGTRSDLVWGYAPERAARGSP